MNDTGRFDNSLLTDNADVFGASVLGKVSNSNMVLTRTNFKSKLKNEIAAAGRPTQIEMDNTELSRQSTRNANNESLVGYPQRYNSVC